VVDQGWAGSSWSANIPFDYAYYVVPDINAHRGPVQVSEKLDEVVEALPIDFASNPVGEYTYALGYPGK